MLKLSPLGETLTKKHQRNYTLKNSGTIVKTLQIRLFNNKFQNYPNKDYIIEWCNKNNLSWEIEQDIFICKKY